MSLLNRDQILGSDDLETEDVEVKEWGGTVRLRSLSISEAANWSSLVDDEGESRQVLERLVVLTAVDEQGEPLFTQDDVEALGKKSARAIVKVAEVAKKLSALSEDADEELEGNSETDPTEGSSSD